MVKIWLNRCYSKNDVFHDFVHDKSMKLKKMQNSHWMFANLKFFGNLGN